LGSSVTMLRLAAAVVCTIAAAINASITRRRCNSARTVRDAFGRSNFTSPCGNIFATAFNACE
jgi:hypothetical protein